MAKSRKQKDGGRQNVLRIRLSEAERKALDAAAHTRTLDTSTWARMELLQIAKRKA